MAIAQLTLAHCRVCKSKFQWLTLQLATERARAECPMCHAWPGNIIVDKVERDAEAA